MRHIRLSIIPLQQFLCAQSTLATEKRGGGAHPDGMTYRPLSTTEYPDDNKGHWVIFWEVCDLVRLPTESQIKIGAIFQYGKTKPCKKYFVPSGPLVIEG